MANFTSKFEKDLPILNIFVDEAEPTELVKKYENQVVKHNKMVNENPYPDSGFDMFVPADYCGGYMPHTRTKVDFRLVAVMEQNQKNNINKTLHTIPFYIYPRSSISKTPLQLCNSVGIIDCGYRGHLMSYFANNATYVPENSRQSLLAYHVEPYTRLTQICHPCLTPFYVKIHYNKDDLPSLETQRADGGFGSTGV
tara:strand:- start:4813 stop:5403 length:591 start_codon:yes stop_codon:yes gene_type:complete